MIKYLFLVFFLCSSINLFSQNIEEFWEQKYGNDRSKWPIWITNPELMKSGMQLDSISLDQLYCGNQNLLFDESQTFEEIERENGHLLRIQNGFSFIKVGESWKLSLSYKEVSLLEPFECEIAFHNLPLNRFESLETNFPYSFLWRDAYANMIHGYVDESFWNDLVVVMFSIEYSKDIL